MKRAKSVSVSVERIEQNYIFYVCLALVIAMAVIGLAIDALNAR